MSGEGGVFRGACVGKPRVLPPLSFRFLPHPLTHRTPPPSPSTPTTPRDSAAEVLSLFNFSNSFIGER